MAQFLRLAVAAALADDPGQPVPGGQGVRVVVAQDPAPVGQHPAVHRLRLGVPAGLPGEPGQVLAAGQAVGVVRAEDPALDLEDLAAQLLRLGVPALQPDHPGQVVPGGQGFPVVGTAQPVVVVEQPPVQLLGLAEPALHAQRRGQVVPGGQGVEVVLALDPEPVGEQLAVDRLGVAAAAAADQGPGQVAAGGQRGRIVVGQEGRGRHAGLGELPGRGQPSGAEQRLGAHRADREQPGQHRGVQLVGDQVDGGVDVRPQPPPGRPVGRPGRVEPGRGRLEQRHRGLLHGGPLGSGAGGQPDPVGVGTTGCTVTAFRAGPVLAEMSISPVRERPCRPSRRPRRSALSSGMASPVRRASRPASGGSCSSQAGIGVAGAKQDRTSSSGRACGMPSAASASRDRSQVRCTVEWMSAPRSSMSVSAAGSSTPSSARRYPAKLDQRANGEPR